MSKWFLILSFIFLLSCETKDKSNLRQYGVGAQILHKLNIKKINLLTNSKTTKRVGLSGYGLEITDQTSF